MRKCDVSREPSAATVKDNIEGHIRFALSNAQHYLDGLGKYAYGDWKEAQDTKDKFKLWTCGTTAFQVTDDNEMYFKIEEPLVITPSVDMCITKYFAKLHVEVRFVVVESLVNRRTSQYLVIDKTSKSLRLLSLSHSILIPNTLLILEY